jgi:hypothetical protein
MIDIKDVSGPVSPHPNITGREMGPIKNKMLEMDGNEINNEQRRTS